MTNHTHEIRLQVQELDDKEGTNRKAEKVNRLLDNGHPVRLTVHMQGRQLDYHSRGYVLLEKIAWKAGFSTITWEPNLPNGNLTTMLLPERRHT
jgi:translation initiation factor IF-3